MGPKLRMLFLLELFAAIHLSVKADNLALPSQKQGQALVQQYCSTCHSTSRIAQSSGYNASQWQTLAGAMVDLDAIPESKLLIDYLAHQFPANNRRTPKLLPGNLTLDYQTWQVPTKGQRARDPIQGADGTVWWAGQWGNLIGKISRTGLFKEYTLPAGAKPHSVTLDRAGNLWYTGNKNASIGKFDPRTEEITEFKMPDPKAKDPHTAIFDQQGILWFTLQHSNMLGRLNPSTGKITLLTLTTPNARPYGIKIDKHGFPWVACNGSNCLLKVDPVSLEITEYKLPDPRTKVRRLDFSKDGLIWFVNSSQGRLGRFNPNTAEVKEWPSPSGPSSHPYAIAVLGDAIWYNESGMRPDTLVRFDPLTETFQS